MFSRAVGREEHCEQITLACAHGVLSTLGLPLLKACVISLLHCLSSRLLCWEMSEAGPGLYALPRSGPLRFRYLGTPQRHRLCWACILCPSQVQAAQVTRCLASTVAATYRLPRPCRLVFWVYNWRAFSGVPCVSSGELISGCDPPGGCQPSRIPRSLG